MNRLLKIYSKNHDEKTVAWLNSSDLRQTFGLTYQVSCDSHRQWLNQHPDYHIWAIEENGVHWGNAILNVMPRHDKAMLEIYIGDKHGRGMGLGKRAVKELLEKAFVDLQLNRVSLVTRTDNRPAEALYASCGFTQEGLERQSVKTDSGYADQNLWALLKEDWVSKYDH